MTDKQIIIDDQKKTIHRLQQECTEKTNIIIALGNKLQAKEQECEELKEAQKNSRCAWKSLEGTFCTEAQEQLDLLKAQLLDQEAETLKAGGIISKYKQILTEIKEIAEKAREDLYTCESIIYADDDLREILQKISECEGNDE